MTVEVEQQIDLATSWQEYFERYYRDEIRDGFLKSVKKVESEGITDLNCIVINLKLTLDFTLLINYNPEFYDYFLNATPEELKVLIRESSVPSLQALMRNVNEEIILSKRQISVDISLKHIPLVPESVLNSGEFYCNAIPKLTCTENKSDLKGLWDSRPYLLEGRVVGLSKQFAIADVMTYSCTNPRCRNNAKAIRIVGFDDLENSEDLGPEIVKPEIFASSGPRPTKVIKCYNCRDINEIYPFHSSIEFLIAKIKIKDSIFTIDALIVGSESCSKVKISKDLIMIGYPKLSAEIPLKLNNCFKVMKPYYFEVLGVDCYLHNVKNDFDLNKVLSMIIDATSENLRLPMLLLILQLIGSSNSIHFNVSLPGIDGRILERIVSTINYVFSDEMAIGKVNICHPKTNSSKSRQIKIIEQKYPYLLNIVESHPKDLHDESCSLIYPKYFESEGLICIPVDLNDEEESDFIINNSFYQENCLKVQVPVVKDQISISSSAVKILNDYFLNLRRTEGDFPMKQTISLLTKLTKISAISRNLSEAGLVDAEFATKLYSQLKGVSFNDEGNSDSLQNMPMSPSVSFEISPMLNAGGKFI